jgi:sulfite dehydrogenase (cytochrome) subunit B
VIEVRLRGKPIVLLACAVLACAGGAFTVRAEPLTITLPPDDVTLKPGSDEQMVQAQCSICHSLDYITTQPPGKDLAFWTAIVNKMIKVFGAPLPQEDVAKVAAYLEKAY